MMYRTVPPLAILLQLHDLCTMIPVIIGPDAKTDKWKKFVANLQPGLRGKYAKDSDYITVSDFREKHKVGCPKLF